MGGRLVWCFYGRICDWEMEEVNDEEPEEIVPYYNGKNGEPYLDSLVICQKAKKEGKKIPKKHLWAYERWVIQNERQVGMTKETELNLVKVAQEHFVYGKPYRLISKEMGKSQNWATAMIATNKDIYNKIAEQEIQNAKDDAEKELLAARLQTYNAMVKMAPRANRELEKVLEEGSEFAKLGAVKHVHENIGVHKSVNKREFEQHPFSEEEKRTFSDTLGVVLAGIGKAQKLLHEEVPALEVEIEE